MADRDAAVDRLYQLPLDEFTTARNALAKELKRPTIQDLEKPNVAAWAVNQLYWHERSTWDRLVKAGERLRAEHRKLLAGKGSDIRDTEKTHRDAVRDAIDKIKGLLVAGGQARSPATLTAVQETLEALPAADAPGRLTRPLKPMGFEALSGVTVRPGLRIVPRPEKSAGDQAPPTKAQSAKDKQREREAAKAREKEERERKERKQEAEKALKIAEAAMLRAEEAVKKAEKTLGELREKRDDAVSEYQRARLRAHE